MTGFCEDELDGDIAHSRSCAQCPFRPQARHSVFAFSSLNRRRSSNDKMRQSNRVSALALAFAFTCSLVLSEGKVSLYIGLYQLCTYFRVKLIVPRVGKKSNFIQFSCLQNSDVIQSNMRRKRIIFFIVNIVQNFSFVNPSVNWIFVCLIGICGSVVSSP